MKHLLKILLVSIVFVIVQPIHWLVGLWKSDFTRCNEFRKDTIDFIDSNWYRIKKGFNLNVVKTLLIVIVLGSMILYVVCSL